MGDVTVMFTLPDEAFEALQAKARREGTLPGAILRDVLRRDLEARRGEKSTETLDPAFLGALRTFLARDIVEASGWSDLKRRLATRGYSLRLEDGSLTLSSLSLLDSDQT